MELPINYETSSPRLRKKAREEYERLQGGKCFHCGNDLSGPPSKEINKKKIIKSLFPEHFFKYPVHLHHSHKDGMTIGAVHNKCNAVLWQYHGE